MPFCKLNESGDLISSPNYVFGPGYELRAELRDTYTFPVNGWSWYETSEQAYDELVGSRVITRAQAKLALLQMDLLDKLEKFMSSDTTPREYKIAWNDALTFKRHSNTIIAVSQALSLTEEQVDKMFEIGSSLDGF